MIDKSGRLALTLRDKRPLVVAWCIALLLFFVGLFGLVASFQTRSQPLSITSCTPESWVEPARIEGSDRWEKGQDQAQCDRPLAGDQRDSVLVANGDGIIIVGQVCNAALEAVTYDLTVNWLSITGEADFEVLAVPVTISPGCNEPFSFSYTPPQTVVSLVGEVQAEAMLGQWKIVGEATPRSPRKYDPYFWDATDSFSMIAVPENP